MRSHGKWNEITRKKNHPQYGRISHAPCEFWRFLTTSTVLRLRSGGGLWNSQFANWKLQVHGKFIWSERSRYQKAKKINRKRGQVWKTISLNCNLLGFEVLNQITRVWMKICKTTGVYEDYSNFMRLHQFLQIIAVSTDENHWDYSSFYRLKQFREQQFLEPSSSSSDYRSFWNQIAAVEITVVFKMTAVFQITADRWFKRLLKQFKPFSLSFRFNLLQIVVQCKFWHSFTWDKIDVMFKLLSNSIDGEITTEMWLKC